MEFRSPNLISESNQIGFHNNCLNCFSTFVGNPDFIYLFVVNIKKKDLCNMKNLLTQKFLKKDLIDILAN